MKALSLSVTLKLEFKPSDPETTLRDARYMFNLITVLGTILGTSDTAVNTKCYLPYILGNRIEGTYYNTEHLLRVLFNNLASLLVFQLQDLTALFINCDCPRAY